MNKSHNVSPIAVAAAATALSAVADVQRDPRKDLALSIARIAHELNAAYCASLGDYSQAVTWEEAPEWQQDSALKGVLMHMSNPKATPQDSHNSWLADKQANGWVYGAVKDPAKKEHPCMVPYAELPQEQRSKDFIFRGIVHAILREQMRD